MNEERLKDWSQDTQRKTSYTTNIDTTDSIQIDRRETGNVTFCRYLGQITERENRTRQEVSMRIKAWWRVLEKYRETSRFSRLFSILVNPQNAFLQRKLDRSSQTQHISVLYVTL